MSIDAPQMEQAAADLRAVTAQLRASILEDRLTGSELILGCRHVLDFWVKGGGSSLDDPVIGFTGIESQSDHVLGGSQVCVGRDVDRVRFKPGSIAEDREVEEIGRFFNGSFSRSVEELTDYLKGCGPLIVGVASESSMTSGVTKPPARSRTIIGPVIAGAILIFVFGGYILFALLAGDI